MADVRTKETDPKIVAEYNNLLKNTNDTLSDMLGISEKLNMSWNNRIQRQGQLASILNKSRTEEIEAQNGLGRYFGIRETEQKIIVSSIKQRIKEEEREMALLKFMNESGIGPFLYIAEQTWKLFLEMDKAVTVFNKTMGMLRQNTATIQWNAQEIAISLMSMGVTIEGVYKSAVALSNSYGSIYIVSQELIIASSLLNAQLGVSEEISAGFFKNMAFISGTTMESQKNMAYMAGALSNAAGTNLSQVMGDVASKSNNTLLLMSRIPEIAIKSATEFRRLGTSMDTVADTSRHILNFTQSVQEEMEASVLLGHAINLQKARELAYHRDLEGSNREILRLTKQNRFNQLDVFQQEAFAKATGRSVSELLNMVQADKEWNDARRNGTDKLKDQIKAYDQLKEANDNILKDKTKQFEMDVQTKSNQERMVAIQQKWNQLVAQVSSFLLPIIDWALAIVPALFPVISLFVGAYKILRDIELTAGKIYSIFKGVGIIALISGKTVDGIMLLFRIPKIIGSMLYIPIMFSKLGKYITPFIDFFIGLGKFGGLLGTFGEAIPIIGEIITAFQFLFGFIRGFENTQGGFWAKLWGGLKTGLLAVVQPILDIFKGIINWIWSFFSNSPLFGHSPSKLGLAIVKGIISVGAMLYDALTWPFRHAFAWILDHVPGMSKFANGLREGAGGISTKVNHSIDTLTSTPQKTPEQSLTETKKQTESSNQQVDQNDTSNKLLQQVITAINNLRQDLNDGKIGVNIDSQRLSSVMARNLNFSGGFGTNH